MHSQRSPVRVWKKLQEILIQDNVVERIYSMLEIPDLGCADFYRARATTAPVSNRLRMPAAGHNRERFLTRHELVSARLRGKIRPRGTETSWSRGRKRSRLWPAAGILRLFLTGAAVVARAL